MTYPPGSHNDPSGWSAPGQGWGSPGDAGYGQGTPPPPAPGQPTYGAPLGSPPPAQIRQQPGVIPLQPLTLGQIYDGALKSIRANPVVMFLFAAVLVTLSTVVQLLTASSLLDTTFAALDELESPGSTGLSSSEIFGALGDSMPSAILGLALGFVISVVLTGVLTYAVSQAVLGFKPSLAQVWDAAKGRMLPLIGLTLLVTLIVSVPPVALIAFIVFSANVLNFSVGALALLILVSALLVLMWVLAVLPTTTLATPALMLEGASPITALRRGWALSKPSFWRVLGIYLLTSVLTGVIASFITTPAAMVSLALPPVGGLIAQGVSAVIASTLVTPFIAAVATLLYIDIRIRREGLAMELAAAAS